MRFLHCSDLHIGSSLTSRLSPLKARQRREELLLSFRRLIDEAREEKADGIIIAGDLFDSESVSKRTLSLVFAAISASCDLAFFYLPGNHERDAIIKCGKNLPENLNVFSEDCSYFDFKDVRILSLCKNKNAPPPLTQAPFKTNILVLHGEIVKHGEGEFKVEESLLESLPCDYIAMGHYHSYSVTVLKNGVHAVYSGTPEGRGFDECGEKGYVILNIENGKISYRFKRRAMRTLHDVRLDISDIDKREELERKIEERLKSIRGEDLVRLTLTGEYSPSLFKDRESLEYYLSDRFFYFELCDISKLRLECESLIFDKSLRGEFVRLVIEDKALSEKEKSDIIELGLRALSGESFKG